MKVKASVLKATKLDGLTPDGNRLKMSTIKGGAFVVLVLHGGDCHAQEDITDERLVELLAKNGLKPTDI